jgi:hypothetical protein
MQFNYFHGFTVHTTSHNLCMFGICYHRNQKSQRYAQYQKHGESAVASGGGSFGRPSSYDLSDADDVHRVYLMPLSIAGYDDRFKRRQLNPTENHPRASHPFQQ